jgi:hypothetical protein
MTPSPGQAWAKVRPWAAASLPFVFLVVWFWDRGPGLDADDYALTLMHAEALVEGRPYGDTGYIGTGLDVAPPRQPPALPLLVAATMRVAGESNLAPIKATMALAALLFFLLAGLTLARSHGAPVGLQLSRPQVPLKWNCPQSSEARPTSPRARVVLVLEVVNQRPRGSFWWAGGTPNQKAQRWG